MRFGKTPKCAEIPNSREQRTLVLGFCNLVIKLLFLHGLRDNVIKRDKIDMSGQRSGELNIQETLP